MKLFRFRTKFEVVGSIFFVAILLTACVLGGVRIITDSNDNIATFITNSNGGIYALTYSGVQSACNNLSNLSGWVNGNGQEITGITSAIRVGDNCKLMNIRLVANSAANISLIENYNIETSTRNYNITIENVYVDGNGETCNAWAEGSHEWFASYPHAIHMNNVTGLRIKDCVVTHSPGAGIWTHDIINGWYEGNEVKHSGIQNEGTAIGNWNMLGMCANPSYNCTFTSNILHDNYGCGLNVESGWYASYVREDHYVKYGIVTENIAYNNSDGFYFEHCDGLIVSDNYAHHNTKNECYPTAPSNGFTLGQDVRNIDLIGNHADYNGNSDDGGAGISISNSHEITIIGGGCNKNYQAGIIVYDGAEYIDIADVRIMNHTTYGIYMEGKSFNIHDCIFINNSVGQDKGAIHCMVWAGGAANDADYGKVHDNTIDNSGQGIYSAIDNMSIFGNQIKTTTYQGIKVTGDKEYIDFNTIRYPGSYGIEINAATGTSENGSVCHNIIHCGGQWANGSIRLVDAQKYDVYFNTVTKDSALTQYPESAIVEGATAGNNFIMFNQIEGNFLHDTFIQSGGGTIVNRTGYNDWNFYTGVS